MAQQEKIVNKLDNINKTLEKIVKVMDKPESPFLKSLGIGGMIVGIFGIIQVIDIIMKWVKEGIW